MPTKRKPRTHARIGDLRVTERMLYLYRAWQDELRKHARSIRAHNLSADLWAALGHMPWDSLDVLDDQYGQLHLVAYPDPNTRPKRLRYDGRPARRAAS